MPFCATLCESARQPKVHPGAVPIVGPFVAGMGEMDISVFPEARPGEIVEMADPETFFGNPRSERCQQFLQQILGH